MYAYIMQRTQIYLTARESAALDAAARRTGRTRSHLVREAIELVYLGGVAIRDRVDALDASAGVWADRDEDGEAYEEAMRPGRLAERIRRDHPGPVG